MKKGICIDTARGHPFWLVRKREYPNSDARAITQQYH